MIKYNKIMIYFKKTIKKLNKYIKDKNRRKYKKIKTNIFKNNTSNNISKNKIKICLTSSQTSFFQLVKKIKT